MLTVRCIIVVQQELERLGIHCVAIEQGKAEVDGILSAEHIQDLSKALAISGLELMDNKKNILVDNIKRIIIEMINLSDNPLKINFSQYLTSKIRLDYTYLSNTFSHEQGITIEHFIIIHKIQRVKELIGYNELSLTEISFQMNYSSVAHLSTQFKKITGITPSHFKHQRLAS